MSSESKELFEFKKKLRELKDYQGRGTELVSLYITPGYPLHEVAAKLRDEYGQAGNIKSKSTQKNVQSALEKLISALKTLKKPPENGLALFAGNVSAIEGQTDVQLFHVTPPSPLGTQFYRCESRFVLDPLEELLEHSGTYGLVLVDGKDSTIALLKGKQLKVIRQLHSTAQQKVHKGGQCIHADELVPFADGKIAPISTVHKGDVLIGVDLKTGTPKPTEVSAVFSRAASKAISLTIKNPIRTLNVTPEHRFFTITAKGVVERTASELHQGEMLLFARELPISGSQIATPLSNSGNSQMLQLLDVHLAQFLGYFIGDGTIERTRITLFDERKEVLESYISLATNATNASHSIIRHRPNKGYYELRAHSVIGIEKLTKAFPDVFVLGYNRKIPEAVEKADSAIVAAFLRGLFDAEGSVSNKNGRISLAMANQPVISKLPLLLSRFGIIASLFNKKSKFRSQFGIEISDKHSLRLFENYIGFSSTEKRETLRELCQNKADANYMNQVPINGKIVETLVKSVQMKRRPYLASATMFLSGRRNVSFEVFEKQIIGGVERYLADLYSLDIKTKPIKATRKLLGVFLTDLSAITGIGRSTINAIENNYYKGTDFSANIRNALAKEKIELIQKTEKVLAELKQIAASQCIAAKLVKKKEIIPSKEEIYIDLTLPETQNFVVNGFVVHNSAARYQRIHEESTEKYYQRIGEAMDAFLEQKNFQGVIVGGPGPMKDDFMKLKPFNYQLKILGVVDTGYSDEFGLRELMEKAGDVLKEQEAVKERRLVADFISRVAKNELATYGLEATQQAVDSRRADKVLVTEDMELYDCEFTCISCGKTLTKATEEKIESEPCECGHHRKPGLCRLRITDLVEQAEANGTTVELISLDTDEGRQFHSSFKGVGAFLRY